MLNYFQCHGMQLIWIIVGHEPTVLAVGEGRGCSDIFLSRLGILFSFFLSLGDLRWMTYDFTSFLTVFQPHQDDGWLLMEDCMQWNPVAIEKVPLSSGFQIWDRLSAGQRKPTEPPVLW